MEKIEFRLARTQYMIEKGQIEEESAIFVLFKRTKLNIKSMLVQFQYCPLIEISIETQVNIRIFKANHPQFI